MIAAGIVALVAAVAPVSTGSDAALLAPGGAAPGWARDSATRVFTGAELYGHINGGSEAFLEFGFVRLTVQTYRKGGDEITIELYRMTDSTAALGVYLSKCGREAPDPGLTDRHTVGRFQLQAVRSAFYLVADNLTGRAEHVPALLALARTTLAALPVPDPVHAVSLLDGKAIVPGSLRLIRGPIALEAIISLGDGDVLSLGGRITAAAGRLAGGTSTRIVVPYDDEAIARTAFERLAGSLDPTLAVVAQDSDRLVLRDALGLFTIARRQGSRLDLTVGLRAAP